jgi:two-component system, NarL family, response regulator DegU
MASVVVDILITPREMDVLLLICEGLNSKEIGLKLNMSSRTVETHKNKLLQKFGVANTPQMVALAFRKKLIK